MGRGARRWNARRRHAADGRPQSGRGAAIASAAPAEAGAGAGLGRPDGVQAVIRVLIVDDHPAVVSGLVSALRAEPGLLPLATANGTSAALNEAARHAADVALLDYQLRDGDGLLLCHELKQLGSPPAVLLYSAFARRELGLAATVAGADGMVDKGAPLDELFDALRTVAKGGKALPELKPEALKTTVMRVDPDDLPILGMRVDGATLSEIGSVLQLDERELSRRLVGMLERLAAPDRGAVHRR